MSVEIIKCRGPGPRAGRTSGDKALTSKVVEVLKEGPKSFQQLRDKTELKRAILADMRIMTDEKSVNKRTSKKAVVFEYAVEGKILGSICIQFFYIAHCS